MLAFWGVLFSMVDTFSKFGSDAKKKKKKEKVAHTSFTRAVVLSLERFILTAISVMQSSSM